LKLFSNISAKLSSLFASVASLFESINTFLQ
jgi:hypothetical protein